MSYDRMGRRVTKNAQRFVYDGYLQIANFEHATSNIELQTFVWDPTEPVATRPLVWNRDASSAYYSHDGNKNVSEVVATDGVTCAHYEYTPFGEVLVMRGVEAQSNPWRFSSEYAEGDSATVYYNYRHYEPIAGRWMCRDLFLRYRQVVEEYLFCNNVFRGQSIDILGLYKKTLRYDMAEDSKEEWYNPRTVVDSSITSVVERIKREIDPYCPKGEKDGNPKCCHCIERIVLAGHGSNGQINLGDDIVTAMWLRLHQKGEDGKFAFAPKHLLELLDVIKDRLCDGGTIQFVTCASGGGDEGLDLMDALKEFFGDGVKIILYNGNVSYCYDMGFPYCGATKSKPKK